MRRRRTHFDFTEPTSRLVVIGQRTVGVKVENYTPTCDTKKDIHLVLRQSSYSDSKHSMNAWIYVCCRARLDAAPGKALQDKAIIPVNSKQQMGGLRTGMMTGYFSPRVANC